MDVVYQQCNNGIKYCIVICIGIFELIYCWFNCGVFVIKIIMILIEEMIVMLEDYSNVDKEMVDILGNVVVFCVLELCGKVQGFNNKVLCDIFYGLIVVMFEGFMGMMLCYLDFVV